MKGTDQAKIYYRDEERIYKLLDDKALFLQ